MRELEYPFDAENILKKKKALKRMLLANSEKKYLDIKIAILGGQTTENIKLILELFLLNYGIKPVFYESEYNKYFEDGFFENHELEEFKPDLVYVCTCNRNITDYPSLSDGLEIVDEKRKYVIDKFNSLWDSIYQRYHCTIIQNNFDYPYFRLMGNKDASDCHGRVNFVTSLNLAFYDYAQCHEYFFICDINYISASYGLEKWSDPYYWHMYKYGVSVPAIPYLSFNVANIIKSLWGKNKKVLCLDLDNTLWGGVVGDDGADNIEIGQETAIAQTYSEFQEYIKLHKKLGVLLTVNSKNDMCNALSGLQRPDSILKTNDFAVIKANWNSKDINLIETANELGLLPESFVFVDDNPVERDVVRCGTDGVSIPEFDAAEHYVNYIDKSGYFEQTMISPEDLTRNEMYQENVNRSHFQAKFDDYTEYLRSLEMKARISEIDSTYISRIAQLTNKSNQFNLTTKRYSPNDIEDFANNDEYITLYGKLSDKFGDNGVVSVVIGHIQGEKNDELHMELWLMSCRVLKREMEYAMMDELVAKAKVRGIRRIVGYYFPTLKNSMVKNFYELQGFKRVQEDDDGTSIWEFAICDDYKNKQNVIDVN